MLSHCSGSRGGKSQNDSGYQSSGLTSTSSSQSAGDPGHLSCNCGSPCVVLTTRKEGPNQGRDFFKCESGGCSFFQWCDQPALPAAAGSRGGNSGWQTSQAAGSPGSSGAVFGNNATSINCKCALPAVRRTVNKEGSNKGREFDTCAKPRGEQCGFFQWADEVPSTSAQVGLPIHLLPLSFRKKGSEEYLAS